MRRTLLLAHCMMWCAIQTVSASTFDKTPLAPEMGVDALTRRVAREQAGRDLFADPYATVIIANVDVYDRFPYLESREFQVVSDARWNRLVYGERGGASLRAFDGRGSTLGALSEPRGMAVDERNRVYVADGGNNRIVVLQATTDRNTIDLVPLYAIDGLGSPFDVAYSDGGTPFLAGDDYLYVADTGKNRVVVFAVDESGARQVATLGDLGSGVGRFAGPLAIAAGRAGGVATGDVYVADAHNGRIVHLRHGESGLEWIGEVRQETNLLTSLATDQWGNVYAAAPDRGVVRKFSPTLARVADLQGGLSRPRSFHVPFVTVHDHRDGRVTRVGQPNGVSIDQWSDQSGVRLWTLGVELSELAVAGGDAPVAHFTLTDRADVSLEVLDAASGRSLAQRRVGALPAGLHSVPIRPEDLRGVAGGRDLVLRVAAASSYPNGTSDVAQTRFQVGRGAATFPARPIMLGNAPNPMATSTHIAFVLPATGNERARLELFDASGRRLRTFDHAFTPGLNEVVWDGTDEQGRALRAGVYFYRLELSGERYTRSVILVR